MENNLITPKDTLGYIRRYLDENGKQTFRFIEAKVQRVNIGKKKTSVYTKEFYTLDAEEIESTTRCINTTTGLLVVGEPFLLKEGQRDYFRRVVDDWNTNGAKSFL